MKSHLKCEDKTTSNASVVPFQVTRNPNIPRLCGGFRHPPQKHMKKNRSFIVTICICIVLARLSPLLFLCPTPVVREARPSERDAAAAFRALLEPVFLPYRLPTFSSLNAALYLVSYSSSTCFALSLATLACLEDCRDHFLDSELTDVMAVVLPAPDEEVVLVVAVVMVTRKMFPEEALLLSIISITAPIFLSSALLISSLKVPFPWLPRQP
jgi:hypothetical protein